MTLAISSGSVLVSFSGESNGPIQNHNLDQPVGLARNPGPFTDSPECLVVAP